MEEDGRTDEDEDKGGGESTLFLCRCVRLLGAKKSFFLLLQRPLCAAIRKTI